MNDTILRDISKFLYDYPSILSRAQQGVIVATQNRDNQLSRDETNTFYTDNFSQTIEFFHNELEYLSGETRTEYNESNIQLAARRVEQPHWPIGSNPWTPIYFRTVDAFNGNPRGSTNERLESPYITDVVFEVNLILDGLTGPTGRPISSTYNGGNSVGTGSSLGGISVGDLIHIGGEAYGIVTSTFCTDPDPPATPSCTVTFDLLGWSGNSVPSGESVTGVFPSFSENERIGNTTPSLPNLLPLLKNHLETLLQPYKDFLDNTMIPFVEDNPTFNYRPSQNNAISFINGLRNMIEEWENKPDLDAVDSRWSNDNFIDVFRSSLLSRRDVNIPFRISEIEQNLGQVTQDSDGKYSGDGAYYDYVLAINDRVFPAGGSLSSFYQAQLGIEVAENSVFSIQNRKQNTDNIMFVARLVNDSTSANTLNVDDTSGLSVGDQILILSETQPTVTRVIAGLTSSVVVMNVAIPQGYLVSDSARAVKLN